MNKVDNDIRIMMLTDDSPSARVIYNRITTHYVIQNYVIEKKEGRILFVQRRIKKFGLFKVVGQLFFQSLVPRILKILSLSRIREIQSKYCMDFTKPEQDKIVEVDSVNSDDMICLLRSYNPDLILICGTRIISQRILDSTPAAFINLHFGITPGYRGVHGGYWAVASNDLANCGVTVHNVDAGIDTGLAIKRATISVTSRDNFVTIQLVQLGVGKELLFDAVESFANGEEMLAERLDIGSKLLGHPTLVEYVVRRVVYGVK